MILSQFSVIAAVLSTLIYVFFDYFQVYISYIYFQVDYFQVIIFKFLSLTFKISDFGRGIYNYGYYLSHQNVFSSNP